MCLSVFLCVCLRMSVFVFVGPGLFHIVRICVFVCECLYVVCVLYVVCLFCGSRPQFQIVLVCCVCLRASHRADNVVCVCV